MNLGQLMEPGAEFTVAGRLLDPSTIAHLWVRVSEDREALRLERPLPYMTVEEDPTAFTESVEPVVIIDGLLRYRVENSRRASAIIRRLCLVRGCPHVSIGATLPARVCFQHLKEPLHGFGAERSLAARLDAYEQEVTRARQEANDLRVGLRSLRAEHG